MAHRVVYRCGNDECRFPGSWIGVGAKAVGG